MGLSEETSALLPQDFIALPEVRFSLTDLLKLSETYSPQIQIARIEKDSQRINVDAARAQHNPTVSLNFSAGYENSTIQDENSAADALHKDRWNPTFHAGISASLPIYTGGAISSEVDLRTADYRKTILAERKLIIEIHKGVKECIMQMELLREQINISRLSIENARTNQRLAEKSYEAGIGSQLELRNAEESLLRAELGILSARYDYLTLLARMSNLIGLGEDFLCGK
jgi:outer membrane protein